MENTIRERKRLSDIHQHGCDDPRITRTHRDTAALINRLNMADNQRKILLQNSLRMPQTFKHIAIKQIRVVTHNRAHQITCTDCIRILRQIRSDLINIARQTIHQLQNVNDLMRQQCRRHISHIGITRIQRRPTNPASFAIDVMRVLLSPFSITNSRAAFKIDKDTGSVLSSITPFNCGKTSIGKEDSKPSRSAETHVETPADATSSRKSTEERSSEREGISDQLLRNQPSQSKKVSPMLTT